MNEDEFPGERARTEQYIAKIAELLDKPIDHCRATFYTFAAQYKTTPPLDTAIRIYYNLVADKDYLFIDHYAAFQIAKQFKQMVRGE